jgi:SOS-response transcriptional repressor LexA
LLADGPRAVLDGLIAQSCDDYASISRLIGRNPAYIQQYIKRRTPRALNEFDRSVIARHFGVEESLLGAPAHTLMATKEVVQIPICDSVASVETSFLNRKKRFTQSIGFDRSWLINLTSTAPDNLALMRVEGDSMTPTLLNGDLVMVDIASIEASLEDGIYAVLTNERLQVKRIAVDPSNDQISILSDNILYPAWDGLDRNSIDIVGRVIWFGRSLK